MNRHFYALFIGLCGTCIFSACAAKSEKPSAPDATLNAMSFEELEAQLRQGEATMLAVGIETAPALAMAGPTGSVNRKDHAGAGGSPGRDFADEADSMDGEVAPDPQSEPAPEMDAPASSPAEAEVAEEGADQDVRTPNRRAQRRQCENVCDIAKTMCGLQDRICDLASQHPDKPRYGQVCNQAQGDCDNAREACDGCQ